MGRRYLTYRQVVSMFRQQELPWVRQQYEQDKVPDYTARCEAFNDFTDALCKDGRISEKQYNDIEHPACCLTPEERGQRRP